MTLFSWAPFIKVQSATGGADAGGLRYWRGLPKRYATHSLPCRFPNNIIFFASFFPGVRFRGRWRWKGVFDSMRHLDGEKRGVGAGKACLSSLPWVCAFFLVAIIPSSAAPPFDEKGEFFRGLVTGVVLEWQGCVQRHFRRSRHFRRGTLRSACVLEVGNRAGGMRAWRLALVTGWRSPHDYCAPAALGAVYEDVARFSRSERAAERNGRAPGRGRSTAEDSGISHAAPGGFCVRAAPTRRAPFLGAYVDLGIWLAPRLQKVAGSNQRICGSGDKGNCAAGARAAADEGGRVNSLP